MISQQRACFVLWWILGILPLAYEYGRGGYEATSSSTHFMPGTADRILELILKRLEVYDLQPAGSSEDISH